MACVYMGLYSKHYIWLPSLFHLVERSPTRPVHTNQQITLNQFLTVMEIFPFGLLIQTSMLVNVNYVYLYDNHTT